MIPSARTTVEVTALTDDIFRVGVFPEGMPVEYRSEAVVFDSRAVRRPRAVRVEDGRIAFEAYGRVFAADDRGIERVQQGPRRRRALLRLR